MNKIIILLLIVTLPLFANNDMFDKMDKETSVSTGIYKLSSSEREALTNWLEGTKKEIIKKEKTKNMGFSHRDEGNREEIHSSIVKISGGIGSKKTYTLANNQVWKQIETESLFIPKSNPNPKVTIKPKSMGSWSFYIDGLSRSVKVKRIK